MSLNSAATTLHVIVNPQKFQPVFSLPAKYLCAEKHPSFLWTCFTRVSHQSILQSRDDPCQQASRLWLGLFCFSTELFGRFRDQRCIRGSFHPNGWAGNANAPGRSLISRPVRCPDAGGPRVSQEAQRPDTNNLHPHLQVLTFTPPRPSNEARLPFDVDASCATVHTHTVVPHLTDTEQQLLLLRGLHRWTTDIYSLLDLSLKESRFKLVVWWESPSRGRFSVQPLSSALLSSDPDPLFPSLLGDYLHNDVSCAVKLWFDGRILQLNVPINLVLVLNNYNIMIRRVRAIGLIYRPFMVKNNIL